ARDYAGAKSLAISMTWGVSLFPQFRVVAGGGGAPGGKNDNLEFFFSINPQNSTIAGPNLGRGGFFTKNDEISSFFRRENAISCEIETFCGKYAESVVFAQIA